MQRDSVINIEYRNTPQFTSNHRFTVAGFHFLTAFWILNSFFPAQGLTLSKVGISLILLSATFCFVLQIFSGWMDRRRLKFDSISKAIFVIFCSWCAVTIIRGFISSNDTAQLFTILANPDIGGLVWILPLAAYLGRDPNALKALLPAFRWHTIIGIALILTVIYQASLGGSTATSGSAKVGLILVYAAPFVLLTRIGNVWDVRLYTLALSLATLAHFLLGNRAAFAFTLGTLLLSMILGQARRPGKILMRVATFILATLAVAMVGYDYLLSRIADDWLIDSRTFLWDEMNNDFSKWDWVFGRGALGQYYSPYFNILYNIGGEGDSPFRQVNEIGYLHLALKTGLIGVILYIAVIIRAMHRATRIYDKRFSFGLRAFLATHLVEMLVIGQASFQPSRVLLWMMVGVALSLSTSQSRRFAA